MSSSTFAVVNLRDGARRDVVPFLLENDAFPILENAYLFRGRIQKRSCFTRLGTGTSRLRWQVGTTDGAGAQVIVLNDAPITSSIIQVTVGATTFTDSGAVDVPPAPLLSNSGATASLDRTTGVLTIAGAPALTAIYYYPGLPVMGLRVVEQVSSNDAINDELLMGFDTRYSYIYDKPTQNFSAANQFVTTNNIFTWEGTSSDQFWTTNYYQVLWATNNIPGLHVAVGNDAPGEGDGIRWYNSVNNRWSNFNPGLNGTTTPVVAPTEFLLGGLIILPYKDRLVVLNTVEGAALNGTRFPQRARWSQNGTPFYVNAPAAGTFSTNAWSSVEVGRGGFIDAPTQEQIVSAEFIKDTLIVYFERSTWQLVYTNNEILPFIWQKINTELGSESTFSTVPFDRGVFSFGNYGIITTDSVNVVRIDEKIPDEIFQIQNKNNGSKRVSGIRDYNSQLVYFSYPIVVDEDNEGPSYILTYPNQVLVYNYLDGSWAEFDDSFTCFGYWQAVTDKTWADLTQSWESSSFAWNSQVLQSKYPDVVAGNQRGFVFVYSQLQQNGQNVPSLEISNASNLTITCPDHNLVNGDYILITNMTGFTTWNNTIFIVANANVNTFDLTLPSPNIIPLATGYTGAGMITHIPKPTIMTKEFNPFYESGDSTRVNYIDILMDKTVSGQISAEFYTNSNDTLPIETDLVLTAPEPTSSYSATQQRIWHRIYSNTFGSFFQNKFTLNDDQMRDLAIATSDITIHGLVYYVNAAGRLSYDV
jgi:hypothetical protein